MLTSQQSLANAYKDALPAWQATLSRFVDEQGRTDFKDLQGQTDELKEIVDAIASVSPMSHPELFPTRNEVIAYHINAYNALAMYGVIDRGIPKNFSSFFKRASFFKFRKVTIGGKSTNLYDYENKVIRPLDEPRVHFALNCMVRDCPRLPQEAFHPDTLDTVLDKLTREFFSKDLHILIDADAKTLQLSGILKFYTKDFVASGKKQDLSEYVNKYVDTPIPADYKVKFIKYDWTINQQPK